MPSPTTNDWELLQAYARARSEPAFEALVSRYLDLVHSAALRHVRDPQLAQEVSQAVFIVLARKAGRLSRHTSLAGWLFRTTRFVAARAVRAEQRRQRREREAVIMQTPSHSAEVWAEVEPMLDEAVAQLPGRDRDAILMRFFLRQNLKEVGARLGTSEEAAKKRLARAVDKLRAFFARRGFTISAALLASALTNQAVQAAPPGTSDAVTRAVHANGAALPASITLLVSETLRELAALKARLALTWSARLAVVILLGALVWQMIPRSGQPGSADASLVPASTNLPAVSAVEAAAADTADESAVGTLPLRVVAADDGHALAGADLIVNYWRVGATRLNLTTDSQGRCAVPLAGKKFDILRVWVSKAGFVPEVINWYDYELGVKNEEYTIRLVAGLAVGGVVQDEKGQPIADARIATPTPAIHTGNREDVGYHPSRDFVLSDATGRWVFRETHGLAPEITFFVTHPDHARLMTYVDMTQPDRTNLVFVLSDGIPLSGVVVTPNDVPVMDASVEEDERHGGPEASARADVEGRFTFAHLNLGRTKLRVQAQGFALLERTVEVATDSAEVRLVLTPAPPESDDAPSGTGARPTIRLSGGALDAGTGLAVDRFSVVLDEHNGTAGHFLGEGRNGAFDWRCSPLFFQEYNLEVKAEGYMPAVSETVMVSSGDHHFEFRLTKHPGSVGRVVLPDGSPAAGAEVFLVGNFRRLRLFEASSPTRKHFLLHTPDEPETRGKTDAEGKFWFRPRAGASGVVAVHAAGCAAVALNALSNGPVVLQPWGGIAGEVRSGNLLRVNEEVSLKVATSTADNLYVPCSRNVRTDTEGRFAFERVPPGQYRVYRVRNFHGNSPGVVGSSHSVETHVESGSTAEVTLGGGGRAVIGRVRLVPDSVAVDWGQRMQQLVRKTAGVLPPNREQFENVQEYVRASFQHDIAEAKYYLAVRPDGSFLVDDVPPGDYRLELRAAEPPPDPLDEVSWMSRGRELGFLTRDVTVPEAPEGYADEPVDLGVVTVELTPGDPPAK